MQDHWPYDFSAIITRLNSKIMNNSNKFLILEQLIYISKSANKISGMKWQVNTKSNVPETWEYNDIQQGDPTTILQKCLKIMSNNV